ncbi:PDZ domain-containing protein [Pedobacter sp. HMF7647]|uniref:PDZ domain-containing protein n=1 Tax=Hufsiella arboris TaxID=2695275 RepID=A0A7K1YDC9_9SPHI|nr:S41 family peptidase [Hufsiella arboris]MXV52048.1 PDZ domain-containing protein [Hufsiella arboris]
MRKRLIYFFALLLAGSAALQSCKKDKKDTGTPSGPPTTGTRDELTKDSIYLYTKELYYWNSSLPDYATFNPRKYSSNEAELFALTQFSNNPETSKPYEYVDGKEPKYSFIDDGTVSGQLGGQGGDYGFSVKADPDRNVRVSSVYATSPAATAGLKRGFKVTKVNGTTVDLTSQTSVDAINNGIFGGNSNVKLTVVDNNGASKDVTVTRGFYNLNPILYTHVYTVGAKKVGYIVYNSFTSDTTKIQSAFSSFEGQGVSELVIDLRYNGGGYVSTSGYMANSIAPASQTGKVMFTYYFNQYLQNLTTTQRKSSVLIHQPILDEDGEIQPSSQAINGKYYTYADVGYQPTDNQGNVEHFSKKGGLNINRVYFIVSGSTASASELLINNLRPVLSEVKLIGTTTYGKPVGFFGIHIDKIDIYTPEFETKNQSNTGGYYSGMKVDQDAVDDVTHDWGDVNETELRYALNYAGTGSFTGTAVVIAGAKAVTLSKQNAATDLTATEQATINRKLDPGKFNGMILDHLRGKR